MKKLVFNIVITQSWARNNFLVIRGNFLALRQRQRDNVKELGGQKKFEKCSGVGVKME